MMITISALETNMFSDEFIRKFGDHVDIEIPNDILEDYFYSVIYPTIHSDISDALDETAFDYWIDSLDSYEEDDVADIWRYSVSKGENPIIIDVW